MSKKTIINPSPDQLEKFFTDEVTPGLKDTSTKKTTWTYNKRVGLVEEVGKHYVCRGIREGCGYLLAAAPDLKAALMDLLDVINRDSLGMTLPASIIQIRREAAIKALLKANGKEI